MYIIIRTMQYAVHGLTVLNTLHTNMYYVNTTQVNYK